VLPSVEMRAAGVARSASARRASVLRAVKWHVVLPSVDVVDASVALAANVKMGSAMRAVWRTAVQSKHI